MIFQTSIKPQFISNDPKMGFKIWRKVDKIALKKGLESGRTSTCFSYKLKCGVKSEKQEKQFYFLKNKQADDEWDVHWSSGTWRSLDKPVQRFKCAGRGTSKK